MRFFKIFGLQGQKDAIHNFYFTLFLNTWHFDRIHLCPTSTGFNFSNIFACLSPFLFLPPSLTLSLSLSHCFLILSFTCFFILLILVSLYCNKNFVVHAFFAKRLTKAKNLHNKAKKKWYFLLYFVSYTFIITKTNHEY